MSYQRQPGIRTSAHEAMDAYEAPIEIQQMHGGQPNAVVTGITKSEPCGFCQGSGVGYVEGETGYRCEACRGTGFKRAEASKRVPVGGGPDTDEFWSGE